MPCHNKMIAIESINLGSDVTAKNRMFFTSMGLDLCCESGMPRPEFISFYKSLMDGGCGFGFLGNASVDDESRYNERGLKLTSSEHADALKPLFKAANDRSFPLGVQLQHYGPQGVPSDSADSILSPSGIASRVILENYPGVQTVAMTEVQIMRCIEQFTTSASLAHKAGASLIQLQASNGYLISSFLSPGTNLREDDWGGTPLKRAKLLLSIIKSIRDVTNGEVLITVRLGIDDGLENEGQHVELLDEVVGALQSAGVSAIECSVGISETFRLFFRNKEVVHNISRKGCRFIKSRVDIPVGFTGSVFGVEAANEIIESGDADFIGFGRAVLADNQLIEKELNGLENQVNRCQGDSFCFRDKREPRAERVYCCVNPNYMRPHYLQKFYEENLK